MINPADIHSGCQKATMPRLAGSLFVDCYSQLYNKLRLFCQSGKTLNFIKKGLFSDSAKM